MNKTPGRRAPRQKKGCLSAGSRAEVLNILQRGHATVSELARSLGLTNNAVRFHLASLQRNGLARSAGIQHGKRRPHVLYQLTELANKRRPNLYKSSLDQLLAELKGRFSSRAISSILRQAGDRLAKPSVLKNTGSAAQRARQAAKLLEATGASVTIERENGTFQVRGKTCPLADVVRHHPEVCNMVEHFLKRSTGALVEQRCQHGPEPRCCFHIARPD